MRCVDDVITANEAICYLIQFMKPYNQLMSKFKPKKFRLKKSKNQW